jgi:hypothetical protein
MRDKRGYSDDKILKLLHRGDSGLAGALCIYTLGIRG